MGRDVPAARGVSPTPAGARGLQTFAAMRSVFSTTLLLALMPGCYLAHDFGADPPVDPPFDRVELSVTDDAGRILVSDGPWDVAAIPLARHDALGCSAR